MAISEITMIWALNSPVYAAKVIKSNLISDEQKEQLINKYGETQVAAWTTEDDTTYDIDDIECTIGSLQPPFALAKASGSDDSKPSIFEELRNFGANLVKAG